MREAMIASSAGGANIGVFATAHAMTTPQILSRQGRYSVVYKYQSFSDRLPFSSPKAIWLQQCHHHIFIHAAPSCHKIQPFHSGNISWPFHITLRIIAQILDAVTTKPIPKFAACVKPFNGSLYQSTNDSSGSRNVIGVQVAFVCINRAQAQVTQTCFPLIFACRAAIRGETVFTPNQRLSSTTVARFTIECPPRFASTHHPITMSSGFSLPCRTSASCSDPRRLVCQ